MTKHVYESTYAIGEDVFAMGIPSRVIAIRIRGYPLTATLYEVSYVNDGQLVTSVCEECEIEAAGRRKIGFKKE